MQQITDGSYIIRGSYADTLYSECLYLIKTDSAGDTIWTRVYGGSWTLAPTGRCVQETADGGFIITGFTESYSSDGSTQVVLL